MMPPEASVIDDPSGLLTRVAELEPLCAADPRIRAAVATGDPFKVYRAILWARLFNRMPEHRPTLDLLATNRRFFAKPLKKGSIGLGTLNGFGVTLVGSAEREPDGTQISTHCIVMLFAIPIFPLGAYVVTPGERSGLSSSWRIFARVPLSGFAWGASRTIALGIVSLTLIGALAGFYAARHHDVYLLNAFEHPLVADIAGTKVTVPANGRNVVNVTVGRKAVTATAPDGTVVETGSLQVPSGGGAYVWNIGGAAALYEVEVLYYSGAPPSNVPEPEPKFLCGQRELVRFGVQNVFRKPPESVSMPKGSGRTSQRLLDVMPGPPGVGGTRICDVVLSREGRDRERLAIAEATARLAHWDLEAAGPALSVARFVGPEEEVRVSTLVRDAMPADVNAARAYQEALRAAGREPEAIAEYKKRAEAAPGDSSAQYLYLRLLRGDQERDLLVELLQKFPTDPYLLRLDMVLAARRGEWAAAEAAWKRLAKVSAKHAGYLLDDAARALVAQGRPLEALDLVATDFRSAPAGERPFPSAVLYARIRSSMGGKDPDLLIRELEKGLGEPLWLLRAIAGLPALPDEKRAGLTAFYDVVGRDAAGALAAAPALSGNELSQLDEASWGLAYGEAIRIGEITASKALQRGAQVRGAQRERFERFVRGEDVVLDEEFDLELRAAACFIRSRSASVPPAEKQRLLAQAKRDDWFHTNVSRAIAQWKGAAPPR